METSLSELRSDCVDLWQLHTVDEAILAEHEVIADAFAVARQQGKIRCAGGSFYGGALPEAALALELFDVIQVTYSVFDQRLADRVLPLALELGVGVVARSVLLKGALTERAESLPEHLEPLRNRSRALVRLVAEAAMGLTPAQAALAFALEHPGIDTVLVGVRSEAELSENLVALNRQLPADVHARMAALRIDDEGLLDPGTWGID